MLSLFFPFLQPYEGSKGFEACCPHFEQTMQLCVQRMKLKLSMQSNVRQWCLRITQDTIEVHVHPRKYMLVYAHASAHMHSTGYTLFQSTHTYTHTPTKAIVPHLVQVVQSIRPRTSLHSTLLGLKDATISAFVCFSWYLCHFKVQIKRADHVQEPGSLPLEQRNQGSTLPSCEKKKGRLTSRRIRQIMADLPA